MTMLGFIDGLYFLFFIPGLLLGLYAQMKLHSAYNHYVRVPADSGLSGSEAAREILDRAGLHSVSVGEVPGHLTDHYDPTRKALLLSSENYHGRSLAAVGVAAHEAGHALQHQAAYAPLQIRMALVPITNFASNAVIWISILGMTMGWMQVIYPAIIVFGIITLFQIVTLPVEFDASRRAKQQLLKLGLIGNHEAGGMSRVLSAAAMTYVAAMVQSLSQLLYFLMLARGHDRD